MDKHANVQFSNEMIDYFEPFYSFPLLRRGRIPSLDQPYAVLMREHMWESHNIYRPSRQYKLITFDATKPEDIREDELVIENEYLFQDPKSIDAFRDLPEWSEQLKAPVNVTQERLQLLSKPIE
jgi:hypothetical protein